MPHNSARPVVREQMPGGVLLVGDCLDGLRLLPDCSVDSIVTDPPYEIGFMGKQWDGTGIAYRVDLWAECLRVLKPGGHLCAFGATRSYHRMAVAIEDAGFEIRDSIHWTYGSGFPKSLNVGKAIDKQKDNRAEIYRVTGWIRSARDSAGLTNGDIDGAFGFAGMAGHWTSLNSQPSVPTLEQVSVLLDLFGLTLDDVPGDIRGLLWTLNRCKGQPGPNWFRREVTGTVQEWGDSVNIKLTSADGLRRDKPATPEAATWDGWGTALKPSHEPIVLARKPLAGTVAANVLEWGTGALNIDATRVGTVPASESHQAGRWPANTILTHHPDCVQDGGGETASVSPVFRCTPGCPVPTLDQQSGGASRYFTQTTWHPQWDAPFLYVPKPSRKERNAGLDNANTHPTVKPVALIQHLIQLITPPGGTVLDPFLGSGTTAAAANQLHHPWIGCEYTPEYVPIIQGRTTHTHQAANPDAA